MLLLFAAVVVAAMRSGRWEWLLTPDRLGTRQTFVQVMHNETVG